MTALLTGIDKIQDNGSEMGEGCNGLHLNRVPLLQWVVKDTRCVHNLDEIKLIKKSEDKFKSVVLCQHYNHDRIYLFAKFYVIMCLTRISKRWRRKKKTSFCKDFFNMHGFDCTRPART